MLATVTGGERQTAAVTGPCAPRPLSGEKPSEDTVIPALTPQSCNGAAVPHATLKHASPQENPVPEGVNAEAQESQRDPAV